MIVTSAIALLTIGQQAKSFPIAPEFKGKWVNAEKGIEWKDRKGKVTIVHFWTFGCINCKRNLDAYNKWVDKFKANGVIVVGVHTPELEIEKDEKKLNEFITEKKIKYPVLVDTSLENWKNWKQSVWPTVYVIDKKGRVRGQWTGELEWKGAGGTATVERWVRDLIAE